jgi:transposase
MLPRDFPPRSTVYGYFRAWVAGGVWAHVHDVLYRRTREPEGREESSTAAIIDSQSVRTGAEAREMVGFDAGKRIKGRKRHLVTDTLSLVLRIEVHSAGVQDRDGAALVVDRITQRFPFLERFFADAGDLRPRVAEAAPRPVEIIKRSDAGFVVQPKRWVVERTFAWACINRRLARDVERFAETARALFQIAMIKLMSRRIARYRDF